MDRVTLVPTVNELRAIKAMASYTFSRPTGIMRIRSCEGGFRWKPEFSAAERSSGSPY